MCAGVARREDAPIGIIIDLIRAVNARATFSSVHPYFSYSARRVYGLLRGDDNACMATQRERLCISQRDLYARESFSARRNSFTTPEVETCNFFLEMHAFMDACIVAICKVIGIFARKRFGLELA